jgi:hypothetical protein
MWTMRSLPARLLSVSLLCFIAGCLAYSQTNEYRDGESGVSLSLPPGWIWTGPERSGNRESTLFLREPGSGQEIKLYVKNLDPPEEIMPAKKMDKRLVKQARRKAGQRIREGFENYRNREDSFELRAINGRSGMRWVADYTQNGRKMVEYFARVRTENTNALFFARLPAEQLDDFMVRIDPVIETLQIP